MKPSPEKSSTLGNLSPEETTLLVMLMNRLDSPAELDSLRDLATEKGLRFDKLLTAAKGITTFQDITPPASSASDKSANNWDDPRLP